MDEAPPAPDRQPSGALLLRVWCDRRGDRTRIIARFFDADAEGAENIGPPRYATGIDEITETVRRWLLDMSGK